MKVEIESVLNGFIVKDSADDSSVEVFSYKNEEEDICLDALQSTLYSVCERLFYIGSKHDKRRLRIIIENQEQ